MRETDAHLSDRELLLVSDGELPAARARHLAGCFACRARQRHLDRAAADVARTQREAIQLPAPDAARSQLLARLAEMAGRPAAHRLPRWSIAAAAIFALLGTLALYNRGHHTSEVPSRRLTPGAARTASREEICNSALPKNQVVPADLRQRVFQAYGMANADPRKYEVDYLITPALGGADDVRNLWPQPYGSTVWNARVKDVLEDRLHDLVCGGQLDLAEAQHDISTDWIAAYKKYFGTDQPVRY
jgi:hypothetical protein